MMWYSIYCQFGWLVWFTRQVKIVFMLNHVVVAAYVVFVGLVPSFLSLYFIFCNEDKSAYAYAQICIDISSFNDGFLTQPNRLHNLF